MFCKLVGNEAKGKLDLTEGLSTTKEESFEIKEDPEHLEAMSALQLSIRQVREGPPCLPSICFYTFINAYQGLVHSFSHSCLPCNTYTNAKILRGMGRSGLTPLEKFKLVKLLKIGLECSWQTKLSLRSQNPNGKILDLCMRTCIRLSHKLFESIHIFVYT